MSSTNWEVQAERHLLSTRALLPPEHHPDARGVVPRNPRRYTQSCALASQRTQHSPAGTNMDAVLKASPNSAPLLPLVEQGETCSGTSTLLRLRHFSCARAHRPRDIQKEALATHPTGAACSRTGKGNQR